MAQEVEVTPGEVQRARLVVTLNDSLNKSTPAAIREIAAARRRPAGEASANGS